ncbi:hypothetical protein [Alloactinosynnema sp. L-07]|nr:hypothetical protein [Alloactinosynnema sp. L-07]
MTEATIAHRVLEELRRCDRALDDDELAFRLGVSPRQSINQVCRGLERVGRLSRYVGPSGKIVNDLRRPNATTTAITDAPALVRAEDVESPSGDSREQRDAERAMLDLLSTRLGIALRPRRFALADGVRIEVDGADQQLSILVEAWAHHGPPKSAQKNKVLADVLKLLHVATTLPTRPRLMLCLCDSDAAHHFTSARSWAAHALRGFDIEVEVVELPADLKAAVLAAQRRQYR